MNNIKAVRLENFQSHLDTFLEFHDGLNVLVGQSDSGKTAIIRGIRWVLFNQPRGTDFIRVGADFVRVTVVFQNGASIVRERTASKNRYIIRKPNEDDLVLEGFGIHVPEEVIEVHGMNSLRIDRDHELFLHISQQLDGPFLLEQTGSLRAKTIGRISGAHYLDMAIRDTSKDISQLQQRTKQGEMEVTQLTEQLEPYQFLTEAKKKINQADKLIESLAKKQRKMQLLQELKRSNRTIKEEIAKANEVLLYVHTLEQWENNLERLQLLADRFLTLQRKKEHTTELNHSIHICQIWIDKTAHVTKADQLEISVRNRFEKWKGLSKISQQWLQVIQGEEQARRYMSLTDFVTSPRIMKLDQLTDREQKKEKLRTLDRQLKINLEENERVKRVHDSLEQLEQTKDIEGKVQQKLETYYRINQLHTHLTDLAQRMEEGSQFVKKQIQDQEQLEHDYQHILTKAGTCPTCGRDFTETTPIN
ncbi:AAA family ATPase [Halalkalibacter urbisdiaboli]|uniref:AAA family ATPase n=1 Tax=Halalkalibacter urbisdiaboli TaxID=1960589 RepID=UPI000B451E88|nr:AAA family ATPase [Halalkalibacter urbisdiaboli]